jgi:hypothetical protein
MALPLNRSEAYYTATVVPGLVMSGGPTSLGPLLSLCGLGEIPADHLTDDDVDFYSEYNFRQSRFTHADVVSWPDEPPGANTPDLVIVGPDWLLAIEAKVFDRATGGALSEQMYRQSLVVSLWCDRLGIPPGRVRHVLLVPEAYAARIQAA